jgi:hypothetical protein
MSQVHHSKADMNSPPYTLCPAINNLSSQRIRYSNALAGNELHFPDTDFHQDPMLGGLIKHPG